MTQSTDLDIQKTKIEDELKNLKANNPLLVALIKEVIRENLTISVNADASYERDNSYINVSVSLYIDGEHISDDQASANT